MKKTIFNIKNVYSSVKRSSLHKNGSLLFGIDIDFLFGLLLLNQYKQIICVSINL